MWEEIYNDGINSVHLKNNKVIVQEYGFKIIMLMLDSHETARFEAAVLTVGFKVRKDIDENFGNYFLI